MMEGAVIAGYKKVTGRKAGSWAKVVGYVWVMCWMSYLGLSNTEERRRGNGSV